MDFENREYSYIKTIGQLSGDGIAIFDIITKTFIYKNNFFKEIFNAEDNNTSLQYDIIYSVIFAEDLDYLQLKYNELLDKKSVNSTEFRLRFPDKKIKHLSCDAYLISENKHIVIYIKDITKIKQHEDYLIKYAAQKDTLLDMLTHNLGGPLLLSKDLISFLKNEDNTDKTNNAKKIINFLQQTTEQCIDIVNDFLKQEHYESATIYVRKTRFDVIEKINVTLEKLRVMNEGKRFIFTSQFKNLNITSDPVKFFQAIHNILSNSIKFTKQSGTIEISVSETDEFYLFIVKDDGIGINDKIKQTIFIPNSIGQLGLNGEKSSGLGLSIAKTLIELLDGRIWFKSELDKGTIFFISLPKNID